MCQVSFFHRIEESCWWWGLHAGMKPLFHKLGFYKRENDTMGSDDDWRKEMREAVILDILLQPVNSSHHHHHHLVTYRFWIQFWMTVVDRIFWSSERGRERVIFADPFRKRKNWIKSWVVDFKLKFKEFYWFPCSSWDLNSSYYPLIFSSSLLFWFKLKSRRPELVHHPSRKEERGKRRIIIFWRIPFEIPLPYLYLH